VQKPSDEAVKAKFLLILLALVWGLSWPIMKIALDEIGVFALRAWGFSISALSLFALIRIQRRSWSIPAGSARLHVAVAGLFNVVGFGLFASLAQLEAATSRVVIINYSMPVWATLMAWPILGERLTARTIIGLALCLAGLGILIYPLAGHSAVALMLALCCAVCWGAGTIYMKWASIPGDLLAISAWQIVLGAVIFIVLLIFQEAPAPLHASLPTVLAVLYNGLIGTGLAYVLWFAIIVRLPTATASLGSLATPVVGVLGSMLLLGERPTPADFVGFALIFAAAACVLLRPSGRAAAQAP
jgi:drug/metabolite transporter (DMT)-like permease